MNVETELPNGTAESSRRKSGRVSRRPDVFAEEEHQGSLLMNGSAKRKRIAYDQTNDSDEDPEDSEEDSDDSEPAEEEVRAKRREQKKRAPAAKPPSKRAKTTPNSRATLAIRSANVQSKPATKAQKLQKARARPSQVHKEGLYAEVFGKSQSADRVAGIWVTSVRTDSVAAIRDLVNFVLKCVECNVEITSSDVEDIDNAANKLGDVLEEHYTEKQSAEYPLISKAKQYAEFKTVLTEFFDALVKALHNSDILYDQPEVYDNIHVWVGTMTGAKYRPFRHTATVVCLTMVTALCDVASDILQSAATTKTQLDAETKKKSRANKGRVASLQESIKADDKRLEVIDASLRDAFDTVYIHRYRDVDEKIRVACVAALGGWIMTYRKYFLEGQYLRYLGWVMSDPNSPTRLEVIRQIKKMFGDHKNVTALRAFTDRFRPRMVEMGSRDADVSVRVDSIDLLDKLRNYELLEPDDIDTIGRLIFDAEPRVRKTVGKFFVSNLEDLYKSITEDWDAEQYAEALPEAEDADDQMDPNQDWIRFKCLAQTLSSYDARSESANSPEDNVRTLASTDNAESRYMLATQSIYPHMAELENWETLAGYLLYDHSSINADPDHDDVSIAAHGTYKLAAGEESILLDVLYFSVKMYLTAVLDLAKERKGRTNASKDEIRKKQETAANNLSTFIPKLLSRYGTTPEAATSILRLEQLLDADLIGDLQGGEATYSALLDDINKQFMSHSDRKVLAEASRAFRAARSFEQSKEATDLKIRATWDDTISSLQTLLQGKSVEGRGTLERNVLIELDNLCIRASNLAGVVDCTDILDQKFAPPPKKGKKAAPVVEQGSVLDLLIRLVERGLITDTTYDRFGDLEDQLCIAVTTIISLYFRWRIVAVIRAIEENDSTGHELSTDSLVELGLKRNNFIEALTPIITSRLALDPVRVTAIHTVLDIYTLFATIKYRQPKSGKGELDDEVVGQIASLTVPLPEELLKEIMHTHERLEKSFARKTGRKILEHKKKRKLPNERQGSRAGTAEAEAEARATQEAIEKLPEDSDSENESDSDNDDDRAGSEDDGEAPTGTQEGSSGREAKKQAALLAEQGLCEVTSKVVLALIGGVVVGNKEEEVKERLYLNKAKLGKSYAGVVGYLDEKKDKSKTAAGKKDGKGTVVKGKAKAVVREARPEPMEVEGDEIEDVDGEEEGDEVEREIVEEEANDALEEEVREREDEVGDGERYGEAGDEDEVMGD